jgi:methylated-DNA-[protein]-cysteine S-methyltransferase
MNVWTRSFDTPLGTMQAATDGTALLALDFDPTRADTADAPPAAVAVLDAAGRWLERYFAGEDAAFGHPVAPRGTPFQRDVWRELQRIPYGATMSYAEIARRVGRPSAVRAVGAANGRNPVAILIPCHRVIGSNGTLTGYAGGLARKQALLALEQRVAFALVA